MAIAFRAAGASDDGTSSCTPGLPSGTAEDDILVCVVSATGNTAFTWPGGWTEIAANNYTGTRRWEVRWKRAGASESDPTISYGGSNVIIGQIAGWSGCLSSATPVDQVSSVTNGVSTSQTYAAVTPTVADTELVLTGTHRTTATISSYSGSNPAPTERFDSSTATGSTAAVHLASGSKNDTTSSGSRTSTRSGANGIDYGTVVFNLLPETVSEQEVDLDGESIASAESVGEPTITQLAGPQLILLNPNNSIESVESVGQPAVAQTAAQNVTTNSITSEESVGTPDVYAVEIIEPDSIVSAEAFGSTLVILIEPDVIAVTSSIASAESVGQPTIAVTPAAPPMDYSVPMPSTPTVFRERWETGTHVGDIAPRMVVEIRRGRWDRDFWTIDAEDEIGATVGDTSVEEPLVPWMAVWDPLEDWQEVPGVLEYTETQSFTENGCQVVTVTLDNVRFTEETGVTALPYHAVDRGYASPTRGYDFAGRPEDGWVENEWYDRLARMAQIRVWMGYGDPQRVAGDMPTDGGTNGMWVFVGQIDDIDPADAPDRITITARNGQPLTDQEFFGWSKSRGLPEPVVFADRATYEGQDRADRWVLVDDAADIVRVILRWAGYMDAGIEDVGAPMKGHKAYNRQDKLIDAITDVCEESGYSFFFSPPVDGDGLALPVFRMNGARDAAPEGMVEVTEHDLLTGVEYKQSMEPLAYIIRVRGKKADATSGGVTLGGDSTTRVMSVYRPPWSFQPGDPEELTDRLGKLLKHVTLTRAALRTEAECETFAKLLAFNEALAALQAVVEIPGHPGLILDTQVGVTDSTLAINSRLWIAERAMTFTSGEDTSWRTVLTGPLLDFPDVAAMLEELEA